jgi:Baseplate J-like protein
MCKEHKTTPHTIQSYPEKNFTNYADSRFSTLLVTNNFGLVGGRDEEDDDSYRFRISLKLQSRGGAAEVDLRLSVLNVPGIQDVAFQRQASSYTAYVYGISPVVPPSLLSLVQAALDERTAYPLVGTAVAPDLVGISLSTTATFVPTASAGSDSSRASAQDLVPPHPRLRARSPLRFRTPLRSRTISGVYAPPTDLDPCPPAPSHSPERE